jgi:phage terminase large subunit GpA-like protein
MYDWAHYVRKYMQAYPENQAPDQELVKTFVNLCLGETYVQPSVEIKATQLMANIRKYKIGFVPEKQSIADGNGKIVLITLAADLGGLMTGYNSDHDDVRLDYEYSAWTENGTEYKLDHGSIGTFTPSFMGKRDPDRTLWTYDISKPYNVWKVFDPLVKRKFIVDTGREMTVGITGIDTGFAEAHAFNYINRTNSVVIGLKGDKDHKHTTFGDNSANWRESPERAKLYLLKVSKLKDQMAQRVFLKWDRASKDPQPPGFINFPQPADGKYDPTTYFAHYEAEERKVDPKNGNFLWQKKSAHHQNHFFDVSIYNMALTDILMENVAKELSKTEPVKWKNPTWPQFCDWLISMMAPPRK